jgi:hypothetical protein
MRLHYHWWHTKTGMRGVTEFDEGTTILRALQLLNQWNRQTVTMWDVNQHHYIYWMD